MRNILRATLLATAMLSLPAYAQIAISGLPAATTPLGGTELLPLVQGGATKNAPVSAVRGNSSPCTNFGTSAGTCLQGAGALGTPSSGTATNLTGLPISTGVSGLGTGVAAGLANNVTGSGALVLATSPTLVTPNIGTPSAGTATNLTGLPISTGVSGLGTGVATALGITHDTTGGICTVGGTGCTTGTVTSIATGAGLTGGTITTTGTISQTQLRCNSGADITGTTYTVNLTAPGDFAAVCNFTGTSASAWTLGAGSAGEGFAVVNNGTANITITATGNINGASTLVLTPAQSASIFYGTSTWWAAVSPGSGGGIPGVSGTGTPTITAGSTDFAGEVTAGSSATSVVIAFTGTKPNAPFCVVTSQTGGIASFAYAISTSAITITQSSTSGNKIDYHCIQH